MSDDKKVIFSMSGLTKTFPGANTPVLKNIYLSFFYGAKIGILGLNGSGKSTLFIEKITFLSSLIIVYFIFNLKTATETVDFLNSSF